MLCSLSNNGFSAADRRWVSAPLRPNRSVCIYTLMYIISQSTSGKVTAASDPRAHVESTVCERTLQPHSDVASASLSAARRGEPPRTCRRAPFCGGIVVKRRCAAERRSSTRLHYRGAWPACARPCTLQRLYLEASVLRARALRWTGVRHAP